MDLSQYIAGLRRQAQQLENQKKAMTKPGVQMRSRWGYGPFVDVTKQWLAELDRRYLELTDIADRLERGVPV